MFVFGILYGFFYFLLDILVSSWPFHIRFTLDDLDLFWVILSHGGEHWQHVLGNPDSDQSSCQTCCHLAAVEIQSVMRSDFSHIITEPGLFWMKSWIEVMRKTVLSDFLENFTYNYYLESDQNRTGCIVAPQQELVRTEDGICDVWHSPRTDPGSWVANCPTTPPF